MPKKQSKKDGRKGSTKGRNKAPQASDKKRLRPRRPAHAAAEVSQVTTGLHSPAVLANFRYVFRFHGERPRGSDFFPASTLFEGRFGRMFRTLPPAEFVEDDLKSLAKAMIAEPENPPTPETEDDDEENPGISAGYTYLGQFIDHD